MRQFSIWSEGFCATGQSGGAHLLGNEVGATFEHACRVLMKKIDPTEQYFNLGRNTYWGCRLYSTKEEAAKSYG